MINTTTTATAASNNTDARSGCGMVVVLEEAVTIGRVGLTLVCMPCNISFVPAVLVDFGTTIVSEQPGH